jgi:large subunit ribosomal protein L19e
MNLGKKKKLAKRTFNVGEDRIVFVESRLDEIKDAITKQDMKDLRKSGAIIIKERKGRTKVFKKRNRSAGNIRKHIGKRKRNYIILTRKFRAYGRNLHLSGGISKDELNTLRKRIRNKEFKSKSHMKELMEARGENKK